MKALAVVAMVVVLVVGACDGQKAATVPTAGASPVTVPPDLVPPELAGLAVTPEDVAALEKKAGDRSYLASTRLWGLRAGAHLRATMQVGRFVPDAQPEDAVFRERIVGQIAQSGARLRVLGGRPVYAASANEQAVYVWFEGLSMVVLSVAADYPEPRRLLRAALEVKL